jgi:hypothetical protein
MTDFGMGSYSKTGGLGVHAKTLYYKTDGTGRDTYIKSNNGGMTQHFKSSNSGFEVGKCGEIIVLFRNILYKASVY